MERPIRPNGDLQGNDSATCFNGFFLGIALVAKLQAEQMYFVVSRNLLALVIINQATVSYLVGLGRHQRYGTAYQPDTEAFSEYCSGIPVSVPAILLARRHLIGIFHSHDAEILR